MTKIGLACFIKFKQTIEREHREIYNFENMIQVQ